MTTYSLIAPQFNAIQFTGANATDIQTFINTYASMSGIYITQQIASGQYFIGTSSGEFTLNTNDWVVYVAAASGNAQYLTGRSNAVLPLDTTQGPLFYTFDSATFAATFS